MLTMTYAVDINPLVYKVDTASPYYPAADAFLEAVRQSTELVYLFWPVIFGFLRISTDPRILAVPLTSTEAIDAIESLLALPQLIAAGERDGFLKDFRAATIGVSVRGRLFSDAHLVALMRQYGVSTIYSHDRDFRKFDGIKVVDPFA
jgi:toxin-antitoxin system PIN domain toxin